MGVEFSSIVIGSHVDLGLVNETSKLDVVGCPDDLDTSESPGRNETSPMAGFAAPGNFLAFRVTDGRVGLGRSP